MNEIQRESGKGVVVAAVVGAVVGAGVALLFAPCSGGETRQWLAHRSRELKGRTTTAFARAKEATIRAAKEIGTDGDRARSTDGHLHV